MIFRKSARLQRRKAQAHGYFAAVSNMRQACADRRCNTPSKSNRPEIRPEMFSASRIKETSTSVDRQVWFSTRSTTATCASRMLTRGQPFRQGVRLGPHPQSVDKSRDHDPRIPGSVVVRPDPEGSMFVPEKRDPRPEQFDPCEHQTSAEQRDAAHAERDLRDTGDNTILRVEEPRATDPYVDRLLPVHPGQNGVLKVDPNPLHAHIQSITHVWGKKLQRNRPRPDQPARQGKYDSESRHDRGEQPKHRFTG